MAKIVLQEKEHKLEEHFTVAEQDTVFISALKEKVWGDLEKRYLVFSLRACA